jgi:hypothetical protein
VRGPPVPPELLDPNGWTYRPPSVDLRSIRGLSHRRISPRHSIVFGGDPVVAVQSLAKNNFNLQVTETAAFLLGESLRDPIFISQHGGPVFITHSPTGTTSKSTWQDALQTAMKLLDGEQP